MQRSSFPTRDRAAVGRRRTRLDRLVYSQPEPSSRVCARSCREESRVATNDAGRWGEQSMQEGQGRKL